MIASDFIKVPLLVNDTRNWPMHEGEYAAKENRIRRGKQVQKIRKQKREKEKEKERSRKPCKSHGSKKRFKQQKKERKTKMTIEWTKKKKGEEERLLGSQETERREKFETSVRNYSVRIIRRLSIRAPTAK